MRYIGIDHSLTKTGVVVLDEDGTELESVLIRSKTAKGAMNRTKRHMGIAQQVKNVVVEYSPCVVAVEGYSFGSDMRKGLGGQMFVQKGSKDRSELRGLIYEALVECGVEFLEPSPRSLKKCLTGNGAATKEDMMAAARDLGFTFAVHDLADALAAAYYAGGWR